jgi:hypothetical protein
MLESMTPTLLTAEYVRILDGRFEAHCYDFMMWFMLAEDVVAETKTRLG